VCIENEVNAEPMRHQRITWRTEMLRRRAK
jgi:hypothetical protein